MGLLSSKIGIAVLAGGTITLGGLGLLFNGSETLQDASNYVRDSSEKIIQYEANENNLFGKLTTLKANADAKSQAQQNTIAQLESDKAGLQEIVTGLEGNVDTLTAEVERLTATLNTEKGDHQATKEQLANKVAELNQAKTDLANAQNQIKSLEGTLNWAQDKAAKADKLVGELEVEVQKANAQVEAHGTVVEENKEATKDDVPMTQEEIDAISTEVE